MSILSLMLCSGLKTIDISFLAMVDGGKNLAKVKIESIDRKNIEEIATILEAGTVRLRKVRPVFCMIGIKR